MLNIVRMDLAPPEVTVFVPVLDRITEEWFRLLADEKDPERGVLHLPNNTVYRVDQVAKPLFIGDDRFLAHLDRPTHAADLVGKGIYFRES